MGRVRVLARNTRSRLRIGRSGKRDAIEPRRLGENQPPRPDHGRQQRDRRGESEKLHEDVGNHRSGNPEEIARVMVGGVAEAGIVGRPRRQAGRHGGGNGQESETDEGAKITLEQAPYGAVAAEREALEKHETLYRDQIEQYLGDNGKKNNNAAEIKGTADEHA